MFSHFEKFREIIEEHKDLPLLREGLKRTRDEVKGLLDPNYRHDSNQEKEQDRIRTEINNQHRFQSFATLRQNNVVKWHLCGHDYFWALSEILDSAREAIFILDWWLSPELYLRRPPAKNEQWRLDRLLQRKAQEGVRVHIVVYKEVTETMTMSSNHTKTALEALHPNIAVMRHPDHIGSKTTVEFWSHHEKLVVVDNKRACIGGLDACFGRWDLQSHPLADAHPTEFDRTLFPGQDYNNARVMDFQQVDNYLSNQISILDTPRMPWEDMHMTLIGPVVLDIVQHFVERWNEIKKRKYKDIARYEWLALPHDLEAAPYVAVSRHPDRESWQNVGRSYEQPWHESYRPVAEERRERPPQGTCNVQVVRSVSDWSHGVLTEHSIQNAYIQLIQEAKHFIYIENQFFISNTGPYGPVTNRIAQALLERILSAARSGQKFKVFVVIPEVPGFAGQIENERAIKIIMAGQWRTINRGGHSIYEEITKAGFEPMDYIRFYHLRTYDRINAPPSFIQEMENQSGVKFHEAQVALVREWLGPENGEWHQDKVSIAVPQATTTDVATMGTSEKKKATIESVNFPASVEEAQDIVSRFESGAPRSDDAIADTVGQHVFMDETELSDEQWLGTPQEELDAYVSELVYIHTKCMIVDDRRVIMGSANLNERSQKGDGDSEIALVVEDTDTIASRMDGKPYAASRFAATLRRKIFRKHLGLIEPQVCLTGDEPVTSFMRAAPHPNDDETEIPEDDAVADPLSDDFLQRWYMTANINTNVFGEIFMNVPTDNVRSWDDYHAYLRKVKTGHVANPYLTLDQVKDKLSQVRGHLVESPLMFLIDQDDLVHNADWDGLDPTLPIYI